ncbi:MAG: 50S ribosomal protein L24 [Candidatus Bathyarchaeota archaeon]|nr:MAG: 50S ribosomal protein L24 [Candidatus Bathyarchaeota archaeon]
MRYTKPRTQRRKLFQASAHRRPKQFSAPLSDDLRRNHNAGAIPVRMGDTVRITRGDRRGFEGKITGISRKKYRIFVEGVTREKVDGTTIQIPIHPSKVLITNLNLDDKWRRETLKRKGATQLSSPETKRKEPSKKTVAKRKKATKHETAKAKKDEGSSKRAKRARRVTKKAVAEKENE